MDFQREELGIALVAELTPLLHEHFKEIAANQDIALDPRWDVYEQAAASNTLRIFTIRDAGRLVGYSVLTVARDVHYKGSVQATQDALFLKVECRGKSVGSQFIKWCDEQLKADGVQVVHQHVSLAHDWGKILERIGYRPIERIYERRLDK